MVCALHLHSLPPPANRVHRTMVRGAAARFHTVMPGHARTRSGYPGIAIRTACRRVSGPAFAPVTPPTLSCPNTPGLVQGIRASLSARPVGGFPVSPLRRPLPQHRRARTRPDLIRVSGHRYPLGLSEGFRSCLCAGHSPNTVVPGHARTRSGSPGIRASTSRSPVGSVGAARGARLPPHSLPTSSCPDLFRGRIERLPISAIT